ncbi:MAG TPA: hypothetical protein VHB45_08915 [Alloacidobacterium sp.]|nr:hypothetical protein [Alloacidobacterium sp.]
MEYQPEEIFRLLLEYCRIRNWSGYDPYDALNSKVFAALPLSRSKIAGVALTQIVKRSPVNLRKLLNVAPTPNAKGLALGLSAVLKAFGRENIGQSRHLIDPLIQGIIALRSANIKYWCWGYSFPWQGRSVIVPRNSPNLVSTVFVAESLIDLYEYCGNSQYLEMAISAAEYIVDELYWESSVDAGFSYPTSSIRNQVHNANYIAAALLCRVYAHTRREQFLNACMRSARASSKEQRNEGSWVYGKGKSQQWIDNFHTGFNLCALKAITHRTGTHEFKPHIERGYEFYRKKFIREDGAPRYFHDATYPIDIHCVAQSIITLSTFEEDYPGSINTAAAVLSWAMNHMWDKGGFFYYRVLRYLKIRTSYMRWGQAWMLLALATYMFAKKRAFPKCSNKEIAATC